MEQSTFTELGKEPNPLDNSGLCLLSLDGGGVRGLSTLYILKSIMDRLNHERKESNLPLVKPCEVFDLIGGTSTGGLIAIMLGRLEMDADQCIAAYSDLAAAVFGEKLSRFPINVKGKVKARFDSVKLKNAIRMVVEQVGASETDLLDDGAERGCKTFVCTIDRDTKDNVRLRSYHLSHEPNVRVTIGEAALATSAATTFFNPVSIGNRSFADGGLGSNNPVDEVEGEASNIWCSETGDLKPLVKCFISIGTGNPGKKAFEKSMVNFLSDTVVQIAHETENTEKKFIARWAKHFDEKRYFRFNVEQGLQNIGLDEYKKKGAMEAATEGYITHKAQYFRMRDCIENMKLKQSKTEKSFAAIIEKYTLRTAQQGPAGHNVPWIVPFERNPHFTGRKSQLAHLEAILSNKDYTIKAAIYGLGGVGKTQLVLELLYRTKNKQKDRSVIWIPANNMESLHQAYLDVARQLRIPGWEDEKADLKRLVQGYLSNDHAGQWLLVFDNSDDIEVWTGNPGSVQQHEKGSSRLIDYLPKSKQGCILFTTRDRKAAVKLAQQNVVEVSEMDEEEATQLLQKCLINPDLINKGRDAASLLSQLTYLPLAIIQAAAYINENGIALTNYLQLLTNQEEEVIDLLSEEFEDVGSYGGIKNPVATTWLISFEQIRQRDRLAADYLSFMSCLDPKDIPQSFLPSGPSQKKETDAIGTLNAYSFISRRSAEADMAFDLHRLVHLAMRNWLRKENLLAQWTKTALMWLKENFPNSNHENRELWKTYLPHARYMLESDLIGQDEDGRVEVAWKYGRCLYEDGRWNEAEVLFKQVIESDKKVLGPEHPDTLISIAKLASTYRSKGRWDEAEELEMQVMETSKRVLGPEHPDTLTSMANLAATYRNKGRWDEAKELEVQVMEIRKRVFSPEHPYTLSSMANLAATYRNKGRWDEAEELEVQVIEIRKRVLGSEHPDTLSSMNNLAYTWKDMNRDTEAVSLMKECVRLSKRILGINHPDTINSSTTLAKWEAEVRS